MSVSMQDEAAVILLAPVATTNATTAFASFDTNGFEYAVIDVISGAYSSDKPSVLNIADCDTTVTASFVTVTGGSATGNLSTSTFGNSVSRFQVDLRARKRYLALNLTMGTTTGVMAAVARLGRAAQSVDTAAQQSILRTGNTVAAINSITRI